MNGPEVTLGVHHAPKGASDVVEAIRADEAHHRDVKHGVANELAGLPSAAVTPAHVELQPNWKAAA